MTASTTAGTEEGRAGSRLAGRPCWLVGWMVGWVVWFAVGVNRCLDCATHCFRLAHCHSGGGMAENWLDCQHESIDCEARGVGRSVGLERQPSSPCTPPATPPSPSEKSTCSSACLNIGMSLMKPRLQRFFCAVFFSSPILSPAPARAPPSLPIVRVSRGANPVGCFVTPACLTHFKRSIGTTDQECKRQILSVVHAPSPEGTLACGGEKEMPAEANGEKGNPTPLRRRRIHSLAIARDAPVAQRNLAAQKTAPVPPPTALSHWYAPQAPSHSP